MTKIMMMTMRPNQLKKKRRAKNKLRFKLMNKKAQIEKLTQKLTRKSRRLSRKRLKDQKRRVNLLNKIKESICQRLSKRENLLLLKLLKRLKLRLRRKPKTLEN